MPDEIDLAQEAQAQANAAAVSLVVYRQPGRGPDMSTGVACCRECGEELPAARLAAVPDAERCVGCQREVEN